MKNNVLSILDWFRAAKPEPSTVDLCVQIGCHIEEFSEMARAIGDGGLAFFSNESAFFHKIKRTAQLGKVEKLTDSDKVELLDSLCDQIVTAVGVAYMAGFDIEGALNEVDRSNWSKFGEDGRPYLDENGKIKKGPDYSKPKLLPFIGVKK